MFNLEATETDNFMNSTAKLFKLIYKDEIYKTLIMKIIPSLYDFLINLKNIDLPFTWKKMYQDYFKVKDNHKEYDIRCIGLELEIICSYGTHGFLATLLSKGK